MVQLFKETVALEEFSNWNCVVLTRMCRKGFLYYVFYSFPVILVQCSDSNAYPYEAGGKFIQQQLKKNIKKK